MENMNFVILAQEIEREQKALNDKRERLVVLMENMGIGTYVQCQNTKTVYKIVKPTGTFMYYRDIDYVRTALADERAGTLSKKEAEEAGFTVLKK